MAFVDLRKKISAIRLIAKGLQRFFVHASTIKTGTLYISIFIHFNAAFPALPAVSPYRGPHQSASTTLLQSGRKHILHRTSPK